MIEKMSERITIQKGGVIIDKFGNHVKDWIDYFSCWCYPNTYTKEEEKEKVRVLDERSIFFEVRYCSELAEIKSDTYRVIYHGDVYDIESVDMMNWQKKTIKLKCRNQAKTHEEASNGQD